jgi:hypothetical protein
MLYFGGSYILRIFALTAGQILGKRKRPSVLSDGRLARGILSYQPADVDSIGLVSPRWMCRASGVGVVVFEDTPITVDLSRTNRSVRAVTFCGQSRC